MERARPALLASTARSPIVQRRLLAVFALTVSLVSLGSVLVSPTGQVSALQSSQLQESHRSTLYDPLPRLCGACRIGAPAWTLAAQSPLIGGAEPRVAPQQLAAAASEAPPDRRFGAVDAFAASYSASYAGIGWERINFDWASLEPSGTESWNRAAVSGAIIAHEIAAGREIVGIIGGTPGWAMDSHGLPRGLYLPANSPANLFGAFVKELARRYRGRVRHWIVWNEPDVWDPHVRGYTWPGSVDDFARLQKVAYVQIKSVDPMLVVHLAATTYWWDAAYGRPLYLGRLLDALARDPAARTHDYYFDVASAHIYNVPDDVERIIRIDHALMRAHGFDKPIWLDETNATPTLDGAWTMVAPPWNATAQEQAAFVAQATSLAIAAGAQRVSFYKMADPVHISPRAYPVGLVRPDGTARPVVAALRATTHALAGWIGAQDLGTLSGIRAVAVDRGGRGGTLVLWNTRPWYAAVTVGIATPSGVAPRMLAAHVAVIADDDALLPVVPAIAGGQVVLHLNLEPSACARDPLCHSRIGGAPVLVVAPSMPHLLSH